MRMGSGFGGGCGVVQDQRPPLSSPRIKSGVTKGREGRDIAPTPARHYHRIHGLHRNRSPRPATRPPAGARPAVGAACGRSEEHTSELQSLMRTSYAVFCLEKKTTKSRSNNRI